MIGLSINSFLQVLMVSACLHPLHVSVTEIELDEKDKMLKTMMRVFIDDLELGVRRKLGQPALDILEPGNGLKTDDLVRDYLKDHFKVSIDNKPQKVVYLGHEQEAEAFIFYIEIDNVKKFRSIRVQNDIITEIHDDQSNLVHVTVKGTTKSLRLMRDTPVNTLTFDSK